MRILHWTEHFRPLIGGTEILLHHLAAAQRRQGHDVLVVTDRVGGLPAEDDLDGVAVRRLPFTATLRANDATGVRRLAAATADLKRTFAADVVHLHYNGMTAWFHLLTAGATPTLVTLHTPFEHLPASADMTARVLRTAGRIATVSDALLRELHARDDTSRTRSETVHNGFPLPALPPAPLPTAPAVVLCLGRFSPEKGFDVALRAFAALAPRPPRGRLVMAGDGPQRSELENLAGTLGIRDCVEFSGWVEPDRVPAVINAASLVLVPSRWQEPFGLVALQAAQLGRPVVASNTGGLPEIVRPGQTGLLAAPGDAGALAAAIASLLAQPDEMQRLGRNAAAAARAHFTLERCAADYERLYRRLLGRGE